MEQEPTYNNDWWAIHLIRSYETTMDDSWRNDFCDSEEESINADSFRLETLLEEIADTLGVGEDEAKKFFEDYRYY